jgi:hypothetical protein
MKRLYKIITFFIFIFLIGIYISVKSINTYFTSEDSNETIIVSTKNLKEVSKVLVINFINN